MAEDGNVNRLAMQGEELRADNRIVIMKLAINSNYLSYFNK
jgi:hypothetical protein